MKAVLSRSRHEKARQAAFADLHREHAAGVYNLALRLTSNREDAKDITQEVLLKAYERLDHDGELNQKAWLYRVTVNACYDHHRRAKRRPVVSGDVEADLACKVDTYEQSELSRQLGSALHMLPPVQRTALILREVHGLKTEEVARILGVQADSAAVTLSRARSSFRKHFLAQAPAEVTARKKGERVLAGAGTCGLAAVAGLHLPSLSLPMAPLPQGLDVGSLVAATGAAGGVATVAAASGGAATTGAIGTVAALLSTKVAAVAATATLVGGSIGGVYATVHHAHAAPSGATPAAAVSPAGQGSAQGVARGSSSGQADSSTLTVGESPDEPMAAPAANASPASGTSAVASGATPVVAAAGQSSVAAGAVSTASPSPAPSTQPSALPETSSDTWTSPYSDSSEESTGTSPSSGSSAESTWAAPYSDSSAQPTGSPAPSPLP